MMDNIREKLVEQLRELADLAPLEQFRELLREAADYIANGVTVGNSHGAGCIDDYGITGKKGPICGCPKCGGYSSIVWDPETDTNTCACGWTDSTTNVTVQEWIPVESEQKPKHRKRYFIAYVFSDSDTHFFGEAMYHADGGNGLVDRPHFSNEGLQGMRVTHWMEIPKLPTPPEGE